MLQNIVIDTFQKIYDNVITTLVIVNTKFNYYELTSWFQKHLFVAHLNKDQGELLHDHLLSDSVRCKLYFKGLLFWNHLRDCFQTQYTSSLGWCILILVNWLPPTVIWPWPDFMVQWLKLIFCVLVIFFKYCMQYVNYL